MRRDFNSPKNTDHCKYQLNYFWHNIWFSVSNVYFLLKKTKMLAWSLKWFVFRSGNEDLMFVACHKETAESLLLDAYQMLLKYHWFVTFHSNWYSWSPPIKHWIHPLAMKFCLSVHLRRIWPFLESWIEATGRRKKFHGAGFTGVFHGLKLWDNTGCMQRTRKEEKNGPIIWGYSGLNKVRQPIERLSEANPLVFPKYISWQNYHSYLSLTQVSRETDDLMGLFWKPWCISVGFWGTLPDEEESCDEAKMSGHFWAKA